MIELELFEQSMDAQFAVDYMNQVHQLLQQQRASPLLPGQQLLSPLPSPQLPSPPGAPGAPGHHVTASRPPAASRRPSAAAAKPYSCNECGRGFKYLHTLSFHVKQSHDSDGGGAEASPTLSHRLSRMRKEPAGGSTSPPSPTMSPVFPPAATKRSGEQLGPIVGGQTMQAMPLLKKSLDRELVPAPHEDQPLSLTKRTSPAIGTIPSPPMLLSANPTPSPSSMPSPMPSRMSSPVVSTSGGPGSGLGSGSGAGGQLGNIGHQSGSNPPTAPSTPTPQDQLLSAPSILQLMKNMHVESQTSLAVQIKGVMPDGSAMKQFVLFRCGICNRTKASLERLLGHIIWFHFADNRKRHCNKCGALFRLKDQLDNHLKLHQLAKENATAQETVKSVDETRTESSEDLEDQAARQRPIKREPEENTTPVTGQQPTGQQTNLQGPQGPQGPGSPVTQTPTEENRRRVSSATDGSLPFHCNFCDKSFDRLFSLQRHERIHTGVKPCYCRVCGRGFSERRNLRHHILRFHAADDVRDDLRGFDTPRLGALQTDDDGLDGLEDDADREADRDSLDRLEREASVERLETLERLEPGFASSPEQPSSTGGSDDQLKASLRADVPPGAIELVQRFSQSPPSPSATAAIANVTSSFMALMAQNQLQNSVNHQLQKNSLAAFVPPSSKRRKGIPTKYTDGPGGLDETALQVLPAIQGLQAIQAMQASQALGTAASEGLFDFSGQRDQAPTLNNNTAPEPTTKLALPTDLSVSSEH
ncbi:zinc finger protein 865-like isoform X1 [Varroa destructor]|uniref:C2H2-type domain-containing protein n=1 Tax=Varroa destructor TaxID=109461 RepID=A0A7M7JLC5_VARDE|nr:zinc finger protein 865-like isoform X1 [Varroa destructor]